MPRATTKIELITSATDQWNKLWKMIDAMPDAKTAVFGFGDNPKLKETHWKRDKNLRDVLIHLYEWHQLLIVWVESNMGGASRSFLPEPYTWKTYGDMNVGFWEKHQSTLYDDAEALLRESHGKVMTLIDGFSNEELFEKKHFSWTGTTSIGAYCISATASHYDWAMKKMKQRGLSCRKCKAKRCEI